MPKKGYKQTEEHKRKIGEAHRGMKRPLGTGEKISKANKNRKFTEEHKKKLSEARMKFFANGGKPWNWTGKFIPNYKHTKTKKYYDWRLKVFTRDNWTCQKCKIRSQKGIQVYLHPHHIKSWVEYPELRYEVSNGITLCIICHKLVHKLLHKNTFPQIIF